MRKFLFVILSVGLFLSSLHAQSSDKYQKLYPKKGDWAVTLSASPFINLVGNLVRFGSDNNFSNPLQLSFFRSIMHMVTDNKARIYSLDYYGTHQTKFYDAVVFITDPLVTHRFDYYKVKDKLTYSFYRLRIGMGTQWRKSKGRFQVYYGYLANLSYIFGPQAKFTPGYDFSKIDTVQSVNYESYTIEPLNNYNSVKIVSTFSNVTRSGSRTLATKYGGGVGLGITGILGVDFFVLPKIAIGGSVSFYGGGNYFFPGQQTYEYFDFNNPNNIIYEQKTEKIPGYFSLDFHYNLVSGLYLRIFL